MDKVKEAIDTCRVWQSIGTVAVPSVELSGAIETLIKTAQSYAALKEKVDMKELAIVPIQVTDEMADAGSGWKNKHNAARAVILAAPKYDMEG